MKFFIKQFISACMSICISPLTVIYFLLNGCIKSDTVFYGFSQLLSLIPGKIGSYLRVGFFRFTMNSCCENVIISFLTIFSHRETEIEAGVYIGPQCNIGKCRIEKNSLLGSGVHIMSGKGQHHFSDLSRPIKDQGGVLKKITIGKDSWLGNGSLIMANIGVHCIIAAGSVVIEDVDDYTIVAGNPAKTIKVLK